MAKKALILLLLLSTSCGILTPRETRKVDRLLRRADRALQKAKAIDPTVSLTDTVEVATTYYIPSVEVKTIFVPKEGDTVVVEKERLKIRYINLPGDTVQIEGECEADTITVVQK